MSKVAKSMENMKKCLCMMCPSYTEICKQKSMPDIKVAMKSDLSTIDHMEAMFCAYGKSTCIEEKNGCVCPGCAIFTENKLENGYFCLENV